MVSPHPVVILGMFLDSKNHGKPPWQIPPSQFWARLLVAKVWPNPMAQPPGAILGMFWQNPLANPGNQFWERFLLAKPWQNPLAQFWARFLIEKRWQNPLANLPGSLPRKISGSKTMAQPRGESHWSNFRHGLSLHNNDRITKKTC